MTLSLVMAISRHAAAVPIQDEVDDSLEEAIRAFLHKPELDDDLTTRYLAVPVDLNGGEPERVIYVTGIRWCGSGGCTTLVARRDGESWEIVSRIRVTETPVRVLDSVSNGWRSLAVPVTGLGPKPSYVAELRFDGTSYPENPTAAGVASLADPVSGDIIIQALEDQEGRLLYPSGRN